MSTTGASSKPGETLVSSAERTGFVEAVLAGKLEPDFSAVAYHFEGWLDKDVMDAVFEVSSGPTEAVSALAGMFPSEAAPAGGSSNSTSGEEGADQPSTSTIQQEAPVAAAAAAAAATAATAAADAVLLANKRHARTLEDIQAQRGPPLPSPTAAAPATAAAEEDEAESPDTEAGPEVEVSPPTGGVDGGISSGSNAELEKVAAFVVSYAAEQEAAPAASRTPTKPPEPPFLVPRGISVPSTRNMHLAIAKTAEKAVELPGFEAFMKMQHGKDSLFRFLTAEHALHSYYLVAKKHVQETVMKGGKAKGACVADPRKEPPAANDKTEDPDVAEIMRMLGGMGP